MICLWNFLRSETATSVRPHSTESIPTAPASRCLSWTAIVFMRGNSRFRAFPLFIANGGNVMREDEITNEDGSEDALKNAPEKHNMAFVVPKTVG